MEKENVLTHAKYPERVQLSGWQSVLLEDLKKQNIILYFSGLRQKYTCKCSNFWMDQQNVLLNKYSIFDKMGWSYL